ncbi:MAG TPA: acylphosphatase [Chloroflexi bacterium]|nr:acylphosphatase [Chloroflexota bacterium]
MAAKRAHLWISGRVQGVNFRYYTSQEAQARGLKGWVRNLWDGRVEAVFEGEEQAVDSMIEWCRKGPPAARVEDIQVSWENPTGEFDRFGIRMTASSRA